MSIDIRRWSQGGAPWQMLAGSENTNGGFLFGEARIGVGEPSPGLHVHEREDESIYVIEGILTLELGDERSELHPGDFVVLPRGIPHRFGNLHDEPVRAVGAVAPTAIEGYFTALDEYFATLSGRPDPERIAEMVAPYGITLLGPPMMREDHSVGTGQGGSR